MQIEYTRQSEPSIYNGMSDYLLNDLIIANTNTFEPLLEVRKLRVGKELFGKRGVNREATMLSLIFASNCGESQYEVNESESGPCDENIIDTRFLYHATYFGIYFRRQSWGVEVSYPIVYNCLFGSPGVDTKD